MPVQRTAEVRFKVFKAKTQNELVDLMNNEAHPYARVVHFGMIFEGNDPNPMWSAVVDLALQLVLTVEDVEMMELAAQDEADSDNSDGSDEVIKKTKLNMAA